jgi:hypothetical protein
MALAATDTPQGTRTLCHTHATGLTARSWPDLDARPRVLRGRRAHHEGSIGTDRSHVTAGGDPPLPISTGPLQSVARCPRPACQPGRLPGGSRDQTLGCLVLGQDSRLDAFSGSPSRT